MRFEDLPPEPRGTDRHVPAAEVMNRSSDLAVENELPRVSRVRRYRIQSHRHPTDGQVDVHLIEYQVFGLAHPHERSIRRPLRTMSRGRLTAGSGGQSAAARPPRCLLRLLGSSDQRWGWVASVQIVQWRVEAFGRNDGPSASSSSSGVLPPPMSKSGSVTTRARACRQGASLPRRRVGGSTRPLVADPRGPSCGPPV